MSKMIQYISIFKRVHMVLKLQKEYYTTAPQQSMVSRPDEKGLAILAEGYLSWL